MIPSVKLKKYGCRSFSFAAPTIWNSLPEPIRNHDDSSKFNTAIKAFYYLLKFCQKYCDENFKFLLLILILIFRYEFLTNTFIYLCFIIDVIFNLQTFRSWIFSRKAPWACGHSAIEILIIVIVYYYHYYLFIIIIIIIIKLMRLMTGSVYYYVRSTKSNQGSLRSCLTSFVRGLIKTSTEFSKFNTSTPMKDQDRISVYKVRHKWWE